MYSVLPLMLHDILQYICRVKGPVLRGYCNYLLYVNTSNDIYISNVLTPVTYYA